MLGASQYSEDKELGLPAEPEPSLLARLRAGAGLLRIEFRRSLGLLVFPVLFAVGWLLSGDVMYGEAYVWLDTSAGVRYTAFFLGPLIGGVSAWMAGRNRRRGMVEILTTTPHPSVVRDLSVWAGTALWGITAYGLLAVALGTLTWWNATWGAPLIGYFLVGLIALIANSAIGYAVGYWLPSRFTAPFVAVALFFLQLAPVSAAAWEPRLQLLSPAPNSLIYRDVFQEVPQVAAQQSLWFVGLAGVALAAVALKATGGRLTAWAALLGFVAVTVAGLFFSIEAAEQNARALGASGENMSFRYVCEEGRIEVCVHPAYKKLLPETAEAVNEVARPLAGIPGVPSRAVQVSNNGAGYLANTRSTVPFYTDSIKDTGWEQSGLYFDEEIARALVQVQGPGRGAGMGTVKPTARDLERCGNVEEPDMIMSSTPEDSPLEPAAEAQEVVKSWLLKRVGSYNPDFSLYQCSNAEDLVDDFAELEPKKRQAWLEENFADLRAGKLALRDLP